MKIRDLPFDLIFSSVLKKMETLKTGQFANLKKETPTLQYWLSRMTIQDGEKWNETVTVRGLVNGNWINLVNYNGRLPGHFEPYIFNLERFENELKTKKVPTPIEEALTAQRRRLFGHPDAAQKLDHSPNPKESNHEQG